MIFQELVISKINLIARFEYKTQSIRKYTQKYHANCQNDNDDLLELVRHRLNNALYADFKYSLRGRNSGPNSSNHD